LEHNLSYTPSLSLPLTYSNIFYWMIKTCICYILP
jgi:hypothetical protein